MRIAGLFLTGLLLLSAQSALSFSCAERTTELGANFNKSPFTLSPALVRASRVEWFRGSVDVYEAQRLLGSKQGPRAQRAAANIEAFKKAKKELGMKTLISFKWYFTKENAPIPRPDSSEERKLFTTLRYLLDELSPYADIFVVGNEPVRETQERDMLTVNNGDHAISPMAGFYIRVADYIHGYLVEKEARGRVKVLMGAFNRLESPRFRDNQGIQEMLRAGLENPHIDGIDLHIHVPGMTEFEQQLEYARNRLNQTAPNKLLTVSEYSLMFLFKRHFNEPLCLGEKGAAFCAQVYPERSESQRKSMTERDFVNDALTRRVEDKFDAEQWGNFFYSRTYLPEDFIQSSYDLMNKYRVDIATYTFDQDDPNDQSTWRWKRKRGYEQDDTPIRLNPLFVPQAVKSTGEVQANPYFYNSFKRLVSEIHDRKAGDCK